MQSARAWSVGCVRSVGSAQRRVGCCCDAGCEARTMLTATGREVNRSLDFLFSTGRRWRTDLKWVLNDCNLILKWFSKSARLQKTRRLVKVKNGVSHDTPDTRNVSLSRSEAGEPHAVQGARCQGGRCPPNVDDTQQSYDTGASYMPRQDS